MASTQENQRAEGLPVRQNWEARNSGMPSNGIFECPLYTDARLYSPFERSDWPYNFFSTMPTLNEPGHIQASVILRIDDHIPRTRESPDFSRTDTANYHGGSITDEIAALTSLCVGIRMRAGGVSRHFLDLKHEPLGRPVAWDTRPTPVISLIKDQLILPEVIGSHGYSLHEVHRLEWLLKLSPEQTAALVRAARLYQDALWIVESEPALAWLMFVSALETAANQWKAENGTAAERLTDWDKKLVDILQNSGGNELVETVAKRIEGSLGAGKKFRDFVLQFLPPPPNKRPTEEFQISWEEEAMTKILKIIYNYRSIALHGGTPFPAPMCVHVLDTVASGGYSEKPPFGSAVSILGGVWKAEDVPINLHSFHYIVRGVLLNWWKEMAGN